MREALHLHWNVENQKYIN